MTLCAARERWRRPQGISGTFVALPHPLLRGLSQWLTAQSIPQQPGQLLLLPLGFVVDPQIQ